MRRHRATSAGRRRAGHVGEDGDQHVVVVGGRRLVGETERPRQLRADPDHGRRPQDAVDARVASAALERDLGVRVPHGRVALTDPRDARHQVVGRRRVGRGALDGEEVGELERREAVDVVDEERITLLRLATSSASACSTNSSTTTTPV